jgi:hypothetical protein
MTPDVRRILELSCWAGIGINAGNLIGGVVLGKPLLVGWSVVGIAILLVMLFVQWRRV